MRLLRLALPLSTSETCEGCKSYFFATAVRDVNSTSFWSASRTCCSERRPFGMGDLAKLVPHACHSRPLIRQRILDSLHCIKVIDYQRFCDEQQACNGPCRL